MAPSGSNGVLREAERFWWTSKRSTVSFDLGVELYGTPSGTPAGAYEALHGLGVTIGMSLLAVCERGPEDLPRGAEEGRPGCRCRSISLVRRAAAGPAREPGPMSWRRHWPIPNASSSISTISAMQPVSVSIS